MTIAHYLITGIGALVLFVCLGQNPLDTGGNFGAGVVPAIIGVPLVGAILIAFVLFVRKDTRR